MIAYLNGKLKYIGESFIIVDVGGVGYKTYIPSCVRVPKLNEAIELYTFLNVAEGIMDLYGFETTEQLSTFEMLKSVSGVGPKAAISILSSLSPAAFALAVVINDYKAITVAKGVGPKLAQKIVLELKDKLKSDDLGSLYEESAKGGSGSSPNEAISALMVLGYSMSEAAVAIKTVGGGLSLEDTIKEALKKLM